MKGIDYNQGYAFGTGENPSLVFTLEKAMNKFFSNFGFWIFIALFIGWRVWDNYTTPESEKINELITAAAILVIFIVTIFLAYIIDTSRSKKAAPKPVAQLRIKNTLKNPGAKLSELVNSPLGESLTKFIRDKKIKNQ